MSPDDLVIQLQKLVDQYLPPSASVLPYALDEEQAKADYWLLHAWANASVPERAELFLILQSGNNYPQWKYNLIQQVDKLIRDNLLLAATSPCPYLRKWVQLIRDDSPQ